VLFIACGFFIESGEFMRIKVFFTGGTIGSTRNNGVIGLETVTAPFLIEIYRYRTDDTDTEFDCETLFSVHSENLELNHLKIIYEAVKSVDKNAYNGIIITHGTDTLTYTAQFLSIMLSPKLPVMIVSSNKPLDNPSANGSSNFIGAVRLISSGVKPDIYVPIYTPSEDTVNFIQGKRVCDSYPFTHLFYGVSHGYDPDAVPPYVPRFPERKNIVFLKTYPGLDYSIYDFRQKPDAVLIETYHSGTAKTVSADGTENILDFTERMTGAGIPVYAAPFDSRIGLYESSAAMQSKGLRFLPDITAAAAYVKLLIAYGSFDDEDDREHFLFGN
jgi:L-asparaginase